MKKHMYIIMRYSMLTNDGATWKIGREVEDFNSYKNQLFEPERLKFHEKLFENIAFQSILNQNYDLNAGDFTLLILTSNLLPKENLRKLTDIISPHPWAKIIQLEPNGSQGSLIKKALKSEIENFKEKVCYSTTRLDDDDALASGFLNELYKYVNPQFSGYCISFGSGYAGMYDEKNDHYESFYEYYYPKIALGASYINIYDPLFNKYDHESISVYHNGNHVYTDKKRPTIVDSRKPMFMRTFHSKSDTSESNQKKIKEIKKMPQITNEVLKNSFPFLGR